MVLYAAEGGRNARRVKVVIVKPPFIEHLLVLSHCALSPASGFSFPHPDSPISIVFCVLERRQQGWRTSFTC